MSGILWLVWRELMPLLVGASIWRVHGDEYKLQGLKQQWGTGQAANNTEEEAAEWMLGSSSFLWCPERECFYLREP